MVVTFFVRVAAAEEVAQGAVVGGPEEPRQEIGAPPGDVDPAFAVTVAGSVGPGVLRGRDGWNRELVAGGYSQVGAFAADMGGRLAVQLHGLELSAVPLVGFTKSEGVGVSTTSLFAEVAYDVHHSSFLTLAPSFGLGWVRSSVCFFGDAGEAAPAPEGSPIAQIMRAPGRETCLDADSAALRVGFAVGIAGGGDGGLLFARVRPTFTLPLATSGYASSDAGLPPFAGPSAPHVAFAVNVEVGFGVGGGRRAW
jgi:hypothetical protein